MVKHIPFSNLTIRGKTYTGNLDPRDFGQPPIIYWVFIGNMIVAELMFHDEWIFDQGERFKTLPKLSDEERDAVAAYLGNIAEEDYG